MFASIWTFAINVLVIFVFVMWFWLLITIIGDLFRRSDVGGFGKVMWIILLVLLPFLGVFLYLLTQSSGMAGRAQAQMAQARDELRTVVGFSAADEIEKLAKLKAAGTISDAEYQALRAKLI
jgi:hypothetical protein